MIRATDDVEKVRLFIGQGLVIALQSVVLLIATLVVLWFTNSTLTLVILPILPIAFAVFLVFRTRHAAALYPGPDSDFRAQYRPPRKSGGLEGGPRFRT